MLIYLLGFLLKTSEFLDELAKKIYSLRGKRSYSWCLSKAVELKDAVYHNPFKKTLYPYIMELISMIWPIFLTYVGCTPKRVKYL